MTDAKLESATNLKKKIKEKQQHYKAVKSILECETGYTLDVYPNNEYRLTAMSNDDTEIILDSSCFISIALNTSTPTDPRDLMLWHLNNIRIDIDDLVRQYEEL